MTGLLSRPTVTPSGGRSRSSRALLLALGAAALVVALVWLLAFSPVLGVSTVSVTGERTVSVQQVRDAAGIKSGTPLIRLDTGAVRRRVLALAAVADASVGVSYPSTVTIRVTERVPVGFVAVGTGFALIDGTGRQYQIVAAQPTKLPRFAVPSGTAAQATGRAVAVVAASLPATVLSQLTEIKATGPSGITLVLGDGRTVFWGSADDSAAKAQLLPTLLAQPGNNYDVSDPDLVVAK